MTNTMENENTQDLESQRTRCEVWTRVMGYHRPVSHFNTGKKAEHYGRKHFVECKAANATFTSTYSTQIPVSAS